MTPVEGWKDHIISKPVLHLDTPLTNNTLLNQVGSTAASIYQKCSSLRSRLMRIVNFPVFFTIPGSDHRSTDPVTQQFVDLPNLSQDSEPDAITATDDPSPTNALAAARNNIVRELLETDRKYVQDLEFMQEYLTALSQSNAVPSDEIYLLFSGLNNLLDFQRKFLVRLESTATEPWEDQRWGLHFEDNEDQFEVYETYCMGLAKSVEIMIVNGLSLMKYHSLMNTVYELPLLLVKPIQRICNYDLLLDALINLSSGYDNLQSEELKVGSAAVKRITSRIIEAQRRGENQQIVRHLQSRVTDWKGHNLLYFGNLILHDIFLVTKSDVDRTYHVFLFERILIFCKMADSTAKRRSVQTPLSKEDMALKLKGRIHMRHISQAISMPVMRQSAVPSGSSRYTLSVCWKADDSVNSVTLHLRSARQLKEWDNQINRLIAPACRAVSISKRVALTKVERAGIRYETSRKARGDEI